MGKDNLPKTGGLFLMKRGANGEIAGRNSMDKEKNEMIVELKKTLNRIYDRFEQRMDRHCWKNAVKDAAEKAPDEALKTAAEFIMKHPHIPASCVRSAFLAADLRNRPAMLSELYSEAVVRGLIKRMTAEDPVRYHLIRPDLPEKELDEFIDAVRAAESHLKKGTGLSGGRKGGGSRAYFSGTSRRVSSSGENRVSALRLQRSGTFSAVRVFLGAG